ncbi:hypothetical protein HIM_04556 [Hirsutella minnesotensis 3608]|uniref:Homeobox domain-containing protein n=1 Tax=Hirsutella minnesotensis 3608 TaxID=1043627 RepID=A0A0F7ZPU3_9HYPO|nr:hypothetical protein HIM_04556 [Hirsutella minnesotensis 3608]
MSILTMNTPPPPHAMFRDQGPWEVAHPSSDYSRPRTENKAIALPSIRQTFPDLLDISPVDGPVHRSMAPGPASMAGPGALGSPEYIHSPNSSKRRRVSIEDDQSAMRLTQVPRLYRSPERPPARQLSPPYREQLPAGTETWTSPTRQAPFIFNGAPSAPSDVDSRRIDSRPLPSLLPPTIKYEREPAPIHGHREGTPSSSASSAMDRHSSYRAPEYGYSYHHHPSRYQSLSTSSIRPQDRTPFSSGGSFNPHYQEASRQGDSGSDGKQRKRRGNLPKETTDKLRAWFVAHLQHPYPTEDEKQDLMRQTGLQMNQISNWFINARRRQLPAMINSARAESEVMNGRVGGGNADGDIMSSTERGSDYGGTGKRGEAFTVSDGEGSVYEEEMNSMRQRRAGDLNRESV